MYSTPTFQGAQNRAAFVNKVFFFFAMAILLSAGGVWLGIFTMLSFPELFFNSFFTIGAFIVSLGLVIAVHKVQGIRPLGYILFALFAIISGFTLTPILASAGAVGGIPLILKALLATTFTFAAAGLWGWITKKDLSSLGGILFVSVIGIILISVLNMFLQTNILEMIASIMGIIVFTVYTAYDIQNIKERYPDEMFLSAAMGLYLDFINLFTSILRFFLAGRD
ncbi:MAG: Bax inhibitor-1 family protein [Candidatus Gracilibacteria bacterium]